MLLWLLLQVKLLRGVVRAARVAAATAALAAAVAAWMLVLVMLLWLLLQVKLLRWVVRAAAAVATLDWSLQRILASWTLLSVRLTWAHLPYMSITANTWPGMFVAATPWLTPFTKNSKSPCAVLSTPTLSPSSNLSRSVP